MVAVFLILLAQPEDYFFQLCIGLELAFGVISLGLLLDLRTHRIPWVLLQKLLFQVAKPFLLLLLALVKKTRTHSYLFLLFLLDLMYHFLISLILLYFIFRQPFLLDVTFLLNLSKNLVWGRVLSIRLISKIVFNLLYSFNLKVG